MSVEVSMLSKPVATFFSMRQRTLRRSISLEGRGLFTGTPVRMVIHPSPANTGIVFHRLDRPDSEPLRATVDAVKATPRCTILGNDHFQVQTVEHLLAALRGMQIDNALITLTGPEIPIDDGSACRFVEMIREAGAEELEEERSVKTLTSPVFFSQEDTHIVALPSEEFRFSYTLHYPHAPLIRTQFYSVAIDEEIFEREIAPCRTFCLYEEIEPLIAQGLLKGGGLESAVVVTEDRVLNPGGLRFPNEMVRHKILDLIGDLSLIGMPLLAHIIAVRSGHATNIAFAMLLQNQMNREFS